ncbi:hypothetical protein [Kineococcus rhizosphaerae]|uniref:Alpha-L-rhamnosidase-like protein n=1 Tax=Kineococcus rhizosphaerae TaxID=559628 RepID=A0A2T0R642_9ACTN|nr:hypothetical protein [Kineococcus rhizosphaerae]PRY16622.1 hypothetical protein CLV37_10353 [Kineococcus rhizosphaerae]
MAIGSWAFVFWNDHLDEAAVTAQLEELAAAGLRGVTLSARIGLSRAVGYLTEEFFRLVRYAVDECARLGLAVVLYDEASYPSGSANGAVVARDPAFAARCLVRQEERWDGPVTTYWRPTLGRSLEDRLLVVVLVEEDTGSRRLLPVEHRGLVWLDLPAGRWRTVAVFDVLSGGTIRGAHADQDDESATAPAAASLLDPDAVRAFVELTHDRYAEALGDHLGSTVVAVFTDEPMPTGRGARPDCFAWTPGFEHDLAGPGGAVADVLRDLPLLWEPGSAARAAYDRALRRRVRDVYYGTLHRWCADHGVALTGHPAEPDDLETARVLDWPGQDTVWRWVLPADGTGLRGPESTAPAVAASAARLRGRGPALAEVLGAYGWALTLSEAKWLLDWYLARGVTELVLHAFFASVRGGRAYESEPDLGRFTSYRPYVPDLVRYVNRVADLCDGAQRSVDVAVVVDGERVDDAVAARLLQRQVDFTYVTEADLPAGRFRHVVRADADSGADLLDVPPLALPAAPDLRVTRWCGEEEFWLCFHEGEELLETGLLVGPEHASVLVEDLLTGRTRRVRVVDGRAPLRLEPRQSVAVRFGAGNGDEGGATPRPGRRVPVPQWRGRFTTTLDDEPAVGTVGLGDWAQYEELRRVSGTCVYSASVDVPAGVGAAVLDLGVVGEAVTLRCNGIEVGRRMWAPYRVDVPDGVLQPGRNALEVQVSNSPANHYEGLRRPSGLIGPVTLEC